MAEAATAQEGTRLLADALDAREAIYGLMSGAIIGAVPAKELRLLNALLAAAPVRDRLAQGKESVGWAVAAAAPSAAALLGPVLWAAADLLAGDGLARLRRCGNDECLWLFVDESTSGTRRWCAMASCGNRAKAQRHYLRKTGRAGGIAD
jgi:predicted RNA-binding Zn ribbon-like protein